MIEPLSNSSKTIFDNVKYSTAFLSIVLNSLAVYIIYRHLPHTTKIYKILLVYLTVSVALQDVFLQILLDPIFMFPLPCFYIEGILKKLSNLQTWTYYDIYISMLSSMGIPYLLCALYRNQVILSPTDPFRMSYMFSETLVSVFIIMCLAPGPLFEFGFERSAIMIESYVKRLSSSWPDKIENRIVCYGPNSFYLAFGCAIIIGFSATFFSMLCFHTFYTLNRMNIISSKTMMYHRRMMKLLVIQTVIPVITICMPLSGAIAQYFLRLESPGTGFLIVLSTCVIR